MVGRRLNTTVGVPHVDKSDVTYDVRDCPDSVSAGDEVYQEQYIWEYGDVGGELEGDDENQEYYPQEDRDTEWDQDADLQEGGEVGPRLDGEVDNNQQENEGAEGEQRESGEGELEGECNDKQEPNLQGDGDGSNESEGDGGSGSEGDGGSGSEVDGGSGSEEGDNGVDCEQADSDVDQGGGYYAQGDGDDSDSGW